MPGWRQPMRQRAWPMTRPHLSPWSSQGGVRSWGAEWGVSLLHRPGLNGDILAACGGGARMPFWGLQ